MTNYATQQDLKNITHVDSSNFALKTSLDNLKTEVDKLDIPKLITVPTDLGKLPDKVANDLTTKTELNSLETIKYSSINNLKTKVDGIDSKYVKKSDYGTKVDDLELKIPDVSGTLKISTFNSKVSELENKIKTAENKPDISNLATKTEVTKIKFLVLMLLSKKLIMIQKLIKLKVTM